jgi:hypothetical protein
MSDTLTPDEISRIEKILCPRHSEILFVDGMTTREVAAWAGRHDCELTVVFGDEPHLVPIEDEEGF